MMVATTLLGRQMRPRLLSRAAQSKPARACRLKSRRDRRRESQASDASESPKDRAGRIYHAGALMESVPPAAEAYRSEALGSFGLFRPMLESIAEGTFGTLNGGYRLAAADREQLSACLDRLAEIFRNAQVDFDAERHERILSTISQGLKHTAPWSGSLGLQRAVVHASA